MIQFPSDFLWGAATSAHQVEGNNFLNDWWQDETSGTFKYASGQACRHYDLYNDDFDIAKSLHHNAHRLSVEWSRVEPEPGKYNEAEIEHYKAVIRSLKDRNIEPIVTLHHFTNPVWFNALGGWQNKAAVERFVTFTETIARALSPDVKYWVTINEPMIYIYFGFLLGIWPPHKRGLINSFRATRGLVSAHTQAYAKIHAVYREYGLARPLVSIAKNVRYFTSCRSNFLTRLGIRIRGRLFNHYFLRALIKRKTLDFIGINYYTREDVRVSVPFIRHFFTEVCKKEHTEISRNSLGWDIYPDGMYYLLLEMKHYNLPVFILENGICTDDDKARWDFIRKHLAAMHRAMQEGVKVLGYLHWSLLDNFEWDKGFAPRFGLISVDYASQKRSIRESAKQFAEACRTGRMD